jgi:hypothetical protein
MATMTNPTNIKVEPKTHGLHGLLRVARAQR